MSHFSGHKCQLILGSRTHLPKLLPTASLWKKLLREFQKSLIVSNKNPITSRYFKSQYSISRENRRLAQLPYIVIHPCSNFLMFWRIIALFTFAIYIFMKPFRIAFFYQLPELGIMGTTFILIINAIMYIEIVVKLFSAYYDEKSEMFVLCRKQIQTRYLKRTLILDLISSFPLSIAMEMTTVETRRHAISFDMLLYLYVTFFGFMLCFFSVPKYKRYYEIISAYFDLTARTNLMIMICLCSLYTIHYAAILSLIVPIFLNLNEAYYFGYPAINLHGLATDNTIVFVYAREFLNTLQAFAACGYSNLTDIHNRYKKYGYTLIMLIGWISESSLVIILIRTATSQNRSSMQYDKLMREIKDYCIEFKLPDYLTANILKYMEYKFRNNYFNEERIFQTLNRRIISQITMDQCKQLVDQVDIFKQLPSSMIKNIVRCLKLKIYLPGEYIVKMAEFGTNMHFLETGSAVVKSETGKKLAYLNDGSYFGEISLLMNEQRRIASVVAVELCETYILTRTDFLKVIEKNGDLLAQMVDIANQRLQDTFRSSV